MLESDKDDCVTECNQVNRGVFTSEDQSIRGQYVVSVRFLDEAENAPSSGHPLEHDFPTWERKIQRADEVGHRYSTLIIHLAPLDIVEQDDCDKRNARKAKWGRGQCDFIHKAANLVAYYLSVTSGERLDLRS